jgi:multisubunit Na+/H+ antiporter MnhG subunit
VTAVAVTLMACGVAVEVLACLGVALMPNALARLHYTAVSSLAALLIAAALIVQEGLVQISGRAVLLAAFLLVSNPVLTHVTARAIDIRTRRA